MYTVCVLPYVYPPAVNPQVPLPELAGLRRLPSSSASEPSELLPSCTAASSASGCCRCHTHAVGLGRPIGFHTSPPSPNSDVVCSAALGAGAPAYSAAATAASTISPTAAEELPTRKPLLQPCMRYPLHGVRGDHLDIEVTFRCGVVGEGDLDIEELAFRWVPGPIPECPGVRLISSRDVQALLSCSLPCFPLHHSRGSSSLCGLLLGSWREGGEGAAAVLIDWRSGWLEVVFEAWQEPERWLHLGGERCGDVWRGRPIQEPERWLQAED